MNQKIRHPYADICEKIGARLVAAGMKSDQAQIETEIMVEADVQEVHSHGVRMLPGLLAALEEGRVNPVPEVKIRHEFAAICTLNCDNGPGRFTSIQAMNCAMDRADKFGIGLCLAEQTSHWGRAHTYASHAAEAGYIGICTTNAIPTMAAWGAKKKVIGNNPLAIGVPRTASLQPAVLDMAMSKAAVGKVATWLREERTPPDYWGLDAEGNLSLDPQAILNGAVIPMGEHKGANLALMLELLTAGLSGGLFCHQLQGPGQSGIEADSTKLFIALNVNAFTNPERFKQSTDQFLTYLEQSAAPFLFPGERGWAAKTVNMIEGVPLHQQTVQELRAAGVAI